MNVLWWNVGHAFFEKPSNFIKLYKNEKLDCFYQPAHGAEISKWIIDQNFDVVCLTEISQAEHLNSFNLSDYTYKDWIPSASHKHGRAIMSKIPFIKIVKKYDDQDVTTYDMGEVIIMPVHFHWADTKIRLNEVLGVIKCINEQQKPIVLCGDFNMWQIFGKLQLWKGDRETFKILNRELVEISQHIMTTEMLPGFKLDYVFTQKEYEQKFTAKVPQKYPRLGMDHKPLMILL